jgi:4'-phosphopantetheinyl transferase EntD
MQSGDLLGLRALLPRGVAVEAANINEIKGELYPEEKDYIQHVVKKRKSEFSAGRLLARKALSRLGKENFPLLRDNKNCPIWPEGIIGSITHTQRYCVVVVGRTKQICSLGIDAEILGRVNKNLWKLLFTDREKQTLMQINDDEQRNIATLLFSAKEAFYKYQFPKTKKMLSFHDVEVSVDRENQTFCIVPLIDIGQFIPKNTLCKGKYDFCANHVITTVYGDPL